MSRRMNPPRFRLPCVARHFPPTKLAKTQVSSWARHIPPHKPAWPLSEPKSWYFQGHSCIFHTPFMPKTCHHIYTSLLPLFQTCAPPNFAPRNPFSWIDHHKRERATPSLPWGIFLHGKPSMESRDAEIGEACVSKPSHRCSLAMKSYWRLVFKGYFFTLLISCISIDV